MPDSSEKPQLPRWDFKRRTAFAKKLNAVVFRRWLGCKIDSDIANVMADDLIVVLDCEDSSSRLAIVSTIVQHERGECDLELCRLLSLQLAWNIDLVVKGKPLIRFYGVGDETWMPFEVTQVVEFEHRGRDMVALHLLCIGGRAAGYSVVKRVPWRFLRYFAYQVGFNRKVQYEDNPQTIVGIRFAGLVKPSQADDLDFTEYTTNGSMMKRNKQIIQERSNYENERVDYSGNTGDTHQRLGEVPAGGEVGELEGQREDQREEGRGQG